MGILRGINRPSVPSSPRRAERRAAVVLELILTLPILMIALVAIVEFGLLVSNLQYVESASRAGSRVASRLAPTGPNQLNNGALPPDILTAVNTELANIGPGVVARQVYLEYNVDSMGGVVVMPFMDCGGASTTPCPYVAVNAPTISLTTAYVRVTVFVDFPDVAPNALAYFGLDFSSSVVQQTTTHMWLGP